MLRVDVLHVLLDGLDGGARARGEAQTLLQGLAHFGDFDVLLQVQVQFLTRLLEVALEFLQVS